MKRIIYIILLLCSLLMVNCCQKSDSDNPSNPTPEKTIKSVTGITLSKTSLTLRAGQSETLTASVKPDDATDRTVIWSISDESVATVSAGVVQAVKVGTATITAKSGDKSATCSVTVEKSAGGDLEDTGEEDICL